MLTLVIYLIVMEQLHIMERLSLVDGDIGKEFILMHIMLVRTLQEYLMVITIQLKDYM